MQQAGQDELQSLIVAAGFYFQPPEPPELVGRRLVAIVDEDDLSWHPPRDGQPKTESVEPEPTSPPPEFPAAPGPTVRRRPAQCFESDAVDGVVSLLFITDKDQAELRYELRLDDSGDRAVLAAICRASGLAEITDTEQLHRRPVILHINVDGRVVDAEPNTLLIERRKRDVEFVRRMQEEGWPEDNDKEVNEEDSEAA